MIAIIVIMCYMFYFVLILIKIRFKKIGDKKNFKTIESLEKGFKEKGSKVIIWSVGFFNMFLRIFIATFLAMGSKPLIYKLNEPLGMGYATFASYTLAILIYLMISQNRSSRKSGGKKQ